MTDESGTVRHHLSPKRHGSVAEAFDDWLLHVAKKEKIAGRRLEANELRNGVARPDPRSEQERRNDQQRRHAELNPPPPTDTRTLAERHLEELIAEREAEREASLSVRDRRISKLEKQVAEERAAKESADRLEQALSTDFAKRTRQKLDDMIDHAEGTSSVSIQDLEALRHERDRMERFADVEAVSANVESIRKSWAAGLDAEVSKLRAHAFLDQTTPAGKGDIRTLLT